MSVMSMMSSMLGVGLATRVVSHGTFKESDNKPAPLLLEFHAVSNAKRRLHWIACREVPEYVHAVANLTGRRMKNSLGEWVAPAHAAGGSKVNMVKI